MLDWLNLPGLRDRELKRIASDYDQTLPWTENDEYQKRTMPREFKKPPTPAPHRSTPPVPPPIAATTDKPKDLLSTQIAHKEKQEEVKAQPQIEQHSTPFAAKPPTLSGKMSPIDRLVATTRVSTQVLVPIAEDASFDDNDDEQSQAKRRKTDDSTANFSSTNADVCLSTIDDFDEDDLKF